MFFVLLIAHSCYTKTDAFKGNSFPASSLQHLLTKNPEPLTPKLSLCRLFSTAPENDELSKLIGKRGQIKRKKKSELPNEDAMYESMTTNELEISDEDFESMPEFQVKRPVRKPKITNEDEEAEKDGSGSSIEIEFVDYMADYEDENDFHIPNRIGISTRDWGEESQGFVPSGKLKKQQIRSGNFVPGDLQLAYNALIEKGIFLFETSPRYGKKMASRELSAEHILARCINENQESGLPPLIINTFSNQIWQRTSSSLTSALSASCERLEVSDVEVYQTKNIGWLPSSGIIKGMADAVLEQGQTSYVGVMDVSPLRLRRLKQKIEKLELSLTTNSFEFSLTDRKKEKWIESCKTLGVIPVIRNPLGSGLSSGQYTASNPSGGLMSVGAKFSFQMLEKYQPLHSVLESVAERVKTRVIREARDAQNRQLGRKGPPPKLNTKISTMQVALNYVIAKGGVPLAEINSVGQADEVIGCVGWTLTDEEVSMLESAADLCS